MKQMASAVKVAEAKYPKDQGYRLDWVFNRSFCHSAFADDSLNAKTASHARHYLEWKATISDKASVNSGTLSKNCSKIGGGPHRKRLLPTKYEIGRNASRDCNEKTKQENFEKTKQENFIHSHGHAFLFIPKYHC